MVRSRLVHRQSQRRIEGLSLRALDSGPARGQREKLALMTSPARRLPIFEEGRAATGEQRVRGASCTRCSKA